MKILMIEDDVSIFESLKMLMEMVFKDENLSILNAVSIDEARKQFELNTDIDIITFDGCVKGGGAEPNTLPLVEEFKKTFKGILIAASSRYNEELLKAGCQHETMKSDIPQKIMQILGKKE
jgi:DNA-binding NtrC family response regulator